MKLFKPSFLLILMAFWLANCQEHSENKVYSVSGYAQKGPFQQGGIVTISELDGSLNPTGRVFHATVSDKFGTFAVPQVEFTSSYVELQADGYYFNEKAGATSDERLVLTAIADLSDSSGVNINILTHIAKERIKHLVQNGSKSFEDAKEQAQDEVLAIFNMETTAPRDFVVLDLAKRGELNQKLAAISAILQASRKVNSITSLLTDISSDITPDGTIDDVALQKNIMTGAVLLDVGAVRLNLAQFYGDTIFNSIDKYTKHFIEQSTFPSQIKFRFPTTASSEPNLMAIQDGGKAVAGTEYAIAVDVDNATVSQLPDLEFFIQLRVTSETMDFPNVQNDLAGWEYINEHCNNQTPCFVRVTSYDVAHASKTPLRVTLSGTGELEIEIFARSSAFPDLDQANGIITRYIKW